MSHNEFIRNIGTLHNLLRELERAHKNSYYNVGRDTGQSIEQAVESLTAALAEQHYSEYYYS